MFYKSNDDGYRPLINGITYKVMTTGETTSMFIFRIPKGATIPPHSHPHEQTGLMISGKMNFTIAGETRTVEKGDSWAIPGNIEHDVVSLEDSVVIEVFSPIREDYLY